MSRVRTGLTYAVRVRSLPEPGMGLVTGAIWVGGDEIAKALDATLNCIRRFRRRFEVGARYAAEATVGLKENVAQRMLERFDGVEGAGTAARLMFFNHLPVDWLSVYARRVEIVTGEDVRRVIDRYLVPSDLHIVLVADPSTLESLKYDWTIAIQTDRPLRK